MADPAYKVTVESNATRKIVREETYWTLDKAVWDFNKFKTAYPRTIIILWDYKKHRIMKRHPHIPGL